MDAQSNEIIKESIGSLTDVSNKLIAGNPWAFVIVILIIIPNLIFLIFIIVFGYATYQNTIDMSKNNDILSSISSQNQTIIDVEKENLSIQKEILRDYQNFIISLNKKNKN